MTPKMALGSAAIHFVSKYSIAPVGFEAPAASLADPKVLRLLADDTAQS
jgi:hypothetical protein